MILRPRKRPQDHFSTIQQLSYQRSRRCPPSSGCGSAIVARSRSRRRRRRHCRHVGLQRVPATVTQEARQRTVPVLRAGARRMRDRSRRPCRVLRELGSQESRDLPPQVRDRTGRVGGGCRRKRDGREDADASHAKNPPHRGQSYPQVETLSAPLDEKTGVIWSSSPESSTSRT